MEIKGILSLKTGAGSSGGKILKATLHEIAKIIDNGYNGSIMDDVFRYEQKEDWFYIYTDRCDWCVFIRIYLHENKITVLGPYTDGWQNIHQDTMENVVKYLANIR